MRRMVLFTALLIFFAGVSFAYAHPPYDIKITFNPETKVATAVIMHNVSNPLNHYIKKVDVGLNGKEIIESLEETNNSLLSNKLDMTMRILTVFSAILLPLTVYSNIMSMTLNIPLHSDPNAFWIHVGIMAFIGVVVIVIFKKKKWM